MLSLKYIIFDKIDRNYFFLNLTFIDVTMMNAWMRKDFIQSYY